MSKREVWINKWTRGAGMAACASFLVHCKESPSSVFTAQKTQPGCWADEEIPREGVCGTLELFCCHPDVGKGRPCSREKSCGQSCQGPSWGSWGTQTLPRDPGQPSSRVLGTQSAVPTLKCSQQGHPSGLPHNNHYLLWMLAVPTIHTEDLSPEASHTHWNTNQLPKLRPLLQRWGTEDVKGGTTSSYGGNLSCGMYLEKVNSLITLGGPPYYLQKFW